MGVCQDTTGIRSDLLGIESLPVFNYEIGHDRSASAPNVGYMSDAVKVDGGVVEWGPEFPGGTQAIGSSLSDISRTYSSFAHRVAQTTAGEVVTWRKDDANSLSRFTVGAIKKVYSSGIFTAIHATDGSVVIVGDPDKTQWTSGDQEVVTKFANIKKITPFSAFGDGGFFLLQDMPISSPVITFPPRLSLDAAVSEKLRGGVKDVTSCVFSHKGGVTALLHNGDLAVWLASAGTTSSDWGEREVDGATGPGSMLQWANMQTDVAKVFCNANAFAAIKTDGTVIAYGALGNQGQSGWSDGYGGADFYPVKADLVDIVNIIPSPAGFLGVTSDKRYIYWGAVYLGDNEPAKEYGSPLVVGENPAIEGANDVLVNQFGYAALMPDGGVVFGGRYADSDGSFLADEVKSELYDIVEIYNSYGSFGALRADGSFFTWGLMEYGGDSSEFHKELNR